MMDQTQPVATINVMQGRINAMQNRIDTLEALVGEMAGALGQCAGELEDEVNAKYPLYMLVYPHNQQKKANDMEAVDTARAALAKHKEVMAGA